LAREWALKILYQIDVGKTSVAEAETDALEKLRMEFVQRGSRVASGSTLESECLSYLTAQLTGSLPIMRRPLERALAIAASRLVMEVPYFQEIRFERSLKSKFPGVVLSPLRALAPVDDVKYYPPVQSSDALAQQLAAMVPVERRLYDEFVKTARLGLPQAMDATLRKTALTLARQAAAERTPEAVLNTRQWLSHWRDETMHAELERYRKVGPIVEDQVGAWLRTAGFTVRLLHGTLDRRPEIDRQLSTLTSGWSLERQVSVDRNILRIAAFEMLFMSGIPTGASINEAVELAKKYSTAESGRFVNGVLGTLASHAETATAESDRIVIDEPDTELDLPEISEIEESDTE
jgi:N utilization substance protein B